MNILILLLLSFFALLLTVMTICTFIQVKPPASVVTVVFRMLYQYASKYLIAVIAVGLIVFYVIKLLKREMPTTAGIIFTVIFSVILIAGVIYYVRISKAETQKSGIEYPFVSTPKVKYNFETVDVSSQSGLSQLFVTTPADSSFSDFCIVYLNYGGWKAPDHAAGNWIKNICVSNGYSYAQLAGIGSESGNIIQIVNHANQGIRWLKENYGYDKIFLIGGSAGGTIALLSAFASGNEEYEMPATTVDGVIALYPMTNPERAYEFFVVENPSTNIFDFLGDKIFCSLYSGQTGILAGETQKMMEPVFSDYDSQDNYYEDVDVKACIKNQDIPILMIQGELDSMVVVEDNRLFFDELKQGKKAISYLELPGTEHAFDLVEGTVHSSRIKQEILSWLHYLQLN